MPINIGTTFQTNPIPGATSQEGHIFYLYPVGGTTIGVMGGVVNATGTISTSITAGAASFASKRRTRSSGSSTAGNAAALYTGYLRWYRGLNGGFESEFTFGLNADFTGMSAFVGFSQLITALSGDASALTDCVGLGFDAADTAGTPWYIVTNDASGTGTKTAIPAMVRDTTTGYKATITMDTGATGFATISIVNVYTGALVLAATTIRSDLPTANATMALGLHTYNGAVASSCRIDVSKVVAGTTY